MIALEIPNNQSLDVKQVWQSLAEAHRYLAELKGLCESLPNSAILLDTLSIQEAKDSSEIENIITTHDELYAFDQSSTSSAATKEVRNYIAALRVGYQDVLDSGLIRLNTILRVQEQVEQNSAGLRKLPGTSLKNQTTGVIVYEPPQDAVIVEKLMTDLVEFIHGDDELDPLLRMAIAHHQFEQQIDLDPADALDGSACAQRCQALAAKYRQVVESLGAEPLLRLVGRGQLCGRGHEHQVPADA